MRLLFRINQKDKNEKDRAIKRSLCTIVQIHDAEEICYSLLGFLLSSSRFEPLHYHQMSVELYACDQPIAKLNELLVKPVEWSLAKV